MTKYDALGQFLSRQTASEVPMSFAEIEGLLGFPLPASAHRHAPWWANQTAGAHSQCRAWMTRGWRTSRVDLGSQRVVFTRQGAPVAAGVSEAPAPFLSQTPVTVRLDMGGLSLPARRLLADYRERAGGDLGKAVGRALHEAAIARRGRLIDAIVPGGRRGGDSVAMIREDRDAR